MSLLKPSLVLARPRGGKDLKAIYIGEDAVAAQSAYNAAATAPAQWDYVLLYIRPIERSHRSIEAPPSPPPPPSAPPPSIPERGRRGR